MRSASWLAAVALMAGVVPLISMAQDATPDPAPAPPTPAEAPQPPPSPDVAPVPVPAPPLEAEPRIEVYAEPPANIIVAPPPVAVDAPPVAGQPPVDPRARKRWEYARARAGAANAAAQPPGDWPRQLANARVAAEAPRWYLARDVVGRPVTGSYLGVGTSSPPEALQRQLQLKPGLGLVVEQVEPGSPAEQAGVKEFDVLQKLDDQLLVNPEQLLVLVRTYKAGDEVKLTVIREGKSQELTAKLVERDVPPIRFTLRQADEDVTQFKAADAAPTAKNFSRLRVLTSPGKLGDGVARAGAAAAAGGNVVIVESDADGKERRLEASSIVIDDAEHHMSINSKGGGKHLRVEDKGGNVVFDGPIDTEEQLGKVPTDVRDKIEKMGLKGLTLPHADPPQTAVPVEPKATAPGQPKPQ